MRKILGLALLSAALILAGCGFNGTSTDSSEPTQSSSNEDESIYLVLVNKTHKLPDNWENMVQIDTVKNSLGEELQIEHKTYEQYQLLREELLKEGIQIELDSVYRSVDEQQEIWDEWMAEKGEDYVKKYLAVPGYSEHHTGLAVDIFLIKDGEQIRENEDMIADKEDFAKIHELMPKYGFILRYPEGKESITGYAYEPWHLRYIDSPNLAKEITDKDLTLEEYLGEED